MSHPRLTYDNRSVGGNNLIMLDLHACNVTKRREHTTRSICHYVINLYRLKTQEAANTWTWPHNLLGVLSTYAHVFSGRRLFLVRLNVHPRRVKTVNLAATFLDVMSPQRQKRGAMLFRWKFVHQHHAPTASSDFMSALIPKFWRQFSFLTSLKGLSSRPPKEATLTMSPLKQWQHVSAMLNALNKFCPPTMNIPGYPDTARRAVEGLMPPDYTFFFRPWSQGHVHNILTYHIGHFVAHRTIVPLAY